MAKFYDCLTPDLRQFIAAQHLFFVATACAQGRVNLSPKGLSTFRCLSETEVGYLDLTGSGNETAGHLAHDGRITFMFCSFDKEPKILRLYGRGRAIKPWQPEWAHYVSHFDQQLGQRQIIVQQIESVQTSCGFSIPFMQYMGDRPTLDEWASKKGEAGLAAYWKERNQTTIDGQPTELLKKTNT